MIGQKEKCHIGIDVSKATLDVYILPHNKHMQFKNDSKHIQKLVKKFLSFSSVNVVMEATGGYEKTVAYALAKANICVSVINPRQVRDFGRAFGQLAKTDKIDAKTIALFAERIQPKANVAWNENQQKIAENNTRRRQLVEMITMERNHLEMANEEAKKSIETVLKTLEKELNKINRALEEVIERDSQLSNKNALLKSIKGVGPTVAAGIIAELPEIGNINARQISALAGLAPFNRDSGTLRGKRCIWGGRASVRRPLYMATLVAMRFNWQIKKFYDRLCEAGKPKKLAMIACMRKLLIIMNAMIKHGELWRSQAAI